MFCACQVQIQDGKGCATLTGAVLRRRFPKPDQLLGHSIYVTVTVLTDTGKQENPFTNS